MLTLGIRYLTGCAVASDVDYRSHVEWPPHPGRVFMALAAAHFQTGEDPEERAALEWLQGELAPQISASACDQRAAVTQFVPVNDVPGGSIAPIQSAPGLTRKRQPREFAKAWIRDESVCLHWPHAQPGGHFAAIERLCAKVTRIGHSASLVQVWASDEGPHAPANWLPDEARATVRFRVPASGLLEHLERQFNRRLRPELSVSHGYAARGEPPEPLAPGSVFDPRLFVFALAREDGPYRYLDLAATLQLTSRFRESLLSHLGADIPEVLSGHCGGAPSVRTHVAVFPLPFVGRGHAHGGILGVAVAVPRDLRPEDRRRLLGSLAALRSEGLKLGPLGKWRLEPPEGAAWQDTLRDRAWTAQPVGARQWATVTPYVFDRHAKAKDKGAYQVELADSIRQSWERVRGSQEVSVEVAINSVSAHIGAPASHEFPRLQRKDGSECRHTHAILVFSEPVVGPVLLGAGRYRGYGLCRPL
jgi:CRISPR-associated protein Csb2